MLFDHLTESVYGYNIKDEYIHGLSVCCVYFLIRNVQKKNIEPREGRVKKMKAMSWNYLFVDRIIFMVMIDAFLIL